MKAKKKYKGIDSLKATFGRRFILIWQIGIVLFVIIPIFQSIWYSFSKISMVDTGLSSVFVGFKNYTYAVKADPNYLSYLTDALIEMLYFLPCIVIISMIIGIILSSEFKGRLFFRCLYFLPVIIATGSVLEWISTCTSPDLTSAGVGMNETNNMIDIADLMSTLGLEGEFVKYFQIAISKIFDLVWASGIQIVLFIAGMQSIPDSLYEVSKVEGASKWEEFWFVTFPMLSPITLLVIIFTLVEIVTAKTNIVMSYVYKLMSTLNYDQSSAMLWLYLLVFGAFMGLVAFAFSHFCMKKWS